MLLVGYSNVYAETKDVDKNDGKEYVDSYTTTINELLKDNPVKDKELKVDYRNNQIHIGSEITKFTSELGVSKVTEDKMFKSKNVSENVLKDFGYRKKSGNTYVTSFETCRLIVNGTLPKDLYGCEEYVVKNSKYVVLQYRTPSDAYVAYKKLKEDGEKVFKDSVLKASESYLVGKNKAMDSRYKSMGLDRMQQNSKGDEVIVAVLDTGVNYKLPELEGRISKESKSFVSEDYLNDYIGHGTMVSSVIADSTSDNVKILSCKVLNSDNTTTVVGVDAAINYAANIADVINISIDLNVVDRYSRSYINDSISNAVARNCPVIVAAGNDDSDIKDVFPANSKKVWSVGSIGKDKKKSSFSNHGNIQFCAYGEDVNVLMANGKYESKSGTSFSAPLVASMVALEKSNNKGISSDAIYSNLKEYCEDLGDSGKDSEYGWGLPVYKEGVVPNIDDSECQHEFKVVDHTVGSCVAEGKIIKECTKCGITQETMTGLCELNHVNIQIDEQEPSGTTRGMYSERCKDCNKLLEKKILPAVGHKKVVVKGKKPTHGSEGLSDGIKCARCGEILKEQVKLKAGHSWEDVHRVDATCVSTGKVLEKCSECSEMRERELPLNEKNHINCRYETKKPTCTEGGTIRKICKDCGKVVKIKGLPAVEHNMQTIKKSPTVYSDGYVKRVCKDCGFYRKTESKVVHMKLSKVSNLESVSGNKSIKLTWKGTNDSLYEVSKSYNGKVVSKVIITKTEFKDKGLKCGKNYSYTIKSFINQSGKRVYGSVSSIKTATCPKSVIMRSVDSAGAGKVMAVWSKSVNASGYQVVYGSKSFRTKCTKKTFKAANSDMVKVRPYITIGEKTVYGSFSNAKCAIR